mmetsp:Transcript_20860/g.62787  ORF Transcript_20860/g.62787 Transcript_20860/m.62787 type:complete len:135 (+) Transcript_20860:275-679(+)|eukprot:CAMPEP_0206134646 /NCGR_PEP_ID=MMETSP1473-20131121/128_1 /ASSEMBLY_ACC=CAM_ASM_001109 /TAXON_ID=1461547 /ORGANISM="Stichococcus sp, Strain RCC1054" /LENGTH=134 /DNA_ID=CAMNT_0053526263 /DNA_START=219 /DNA_END=623 /DNA_ORIENTATION=+
MGEEESPTFSQLIDLRPDTTGYNLTVKVLEAKLVQDNRGRGLSRGPQRIAECLVGDSSGTVVFTARDDQVDQLKPGTYLTLTDAKVDMFKGCMRLAVDSNGSIQPSNVKPFQPKTDFNLSLVEYELVHVPADAT